MTTVQDPTVQRRRLRLELRRARDAAGLRQADVARAMDWSPSKLIRIEKGDVSVSTNDLRALLSHYGVHDEDRVDGLLKLARSARGVSFYDQYADLLKPGFKEYLAYEASAAIIRQYDPVLVPGLLQTEEYGRAVLERTAGLSPDDVDKLCTVYQIRQEAVDRERPPETRFIMDEAALRRHVGRGHVMRHQLERLKTFSAEPHISIHIIPFTRVHPGMVGKFALLEFADSNLDDMVYLESISPSAICDEPGVVTLYLDSFAQLEELALPPDESVDFLDVLISKIPAASQPGPLQEAI